MRIGLSQRILTIDNVQYDAIAHGWYEVLKGHSLFFIPNTLNQDFELMANDLDSFIITGSKTTDHSRDVQLTIAAKMLEKNKPVVGICHGAFLLAEMLGADIREIKNHDNISHPIFYHREVREVPSHHDMGIYNIADHVQVICRDYLGNIEAFMDNNIAGIVWHPDRMDEPWIPPEIAYLLKI